MNLDDLKAPFPPDVIEWRVGSTTRDKTKGMALAYINARDVMDRLDAVCGPANWQRRHPWAVNGKLACEIGIRIDGEWVWKGDGAGDTDYEADKGAFSDAFKRAAVSWGIGRYLYDAPSPWVEVEQRGKSYIIKPTELPKLTAALNGKGQPPRQQPQGNGQKRPPANGTPQGGAEDAGRIRIEYPGKPALIPVPAPVEGDDMDPVWAVWRRAFAKAIAQSRSGSDYRAWLDLNKHPLDNLQKHNADWHKALDAWAKDSIGKKFDQTILNAG